MINLLIIDDDQDFRLLVRAHLAREFPQARLVEYDPRADGPPSDKFDWQRFDCVLLDHNLGGRETGLEWLDSYLGEHGQPAVIYLTGDADAYVAARAMKLGADDYLNKGDLSARRLAELITSAVSKRRGEGGSTTFNPPAKLPTRLVDDSPATAAAEPNSPRSNSESDTPFVPGYKLDTMLGRGATSRVYMAERRSDGLTVVVKVLHAHFAEQIEQLRRFVREAELIAGLDSPSVVRIYEQNFTGDSGFIAMEYLPRGDLKPRIEIGLSAPTSLAYLLNIARGIEAIHRVGIIHRDLKPSNIMFRYDDSLALADFGLSRRIDAASELTMTGQIMGTPHYMSPEQGEGRAVDQRSDLYSTGCVFFEMLTGGKPYLAASLTGVIYQHVTAPITQASRRRPRLPTAARAPPREGSGRSTRVRESPRRRDRSARRVDMIRWPLRIGRSVRGRSSTAFPRHCCIIAVVESR